MTTLSPARLAAPALLLLAAGCGPGIDAASPPETELHASSNAIVGGSTDHGHSAVALLYQDPGYICSGTMIDKRVYLTAAHCIESLNPNDYIVVGGTDPFDPDIEPDYVIGVDSVNIHPQYDPENTFNDVGVVILDSDAPVKPYRWLNDAGSRYAIGNEFTAIGYGDTGVGGDTSGKKRKVKLDIVETYSDIYVYGNGTQNTCFGDSGGPDIMTVDGYTTVIGVHSFVTGGDCFQYGGSMRTDDNGGFIDNFAAPDAGTAKVGGGSDNPLACSLVSVQSVSPFPAALLALLALATTVRRRR